MHVFPYEYFLSYCISVGGSQFKLVHIAKYYNAYSIKIFKFRMVKVSTYQSKIHLPSNKWFEKGAL